MVNIALQQLSENDFIHILHNQKSLRLRGGALRDINIFRANRKSLRGDGLLSTLSSIGQFILPTIKKFILPAAGKFTGEVIKDVIAGKKFGESMKKRGKKGLKRVGSKILYGKGVKKRKIYVSFQHKHMRLKNKTKKKTCE